MTCKWPPASTAWVPHFWPPLPEVGILILSRHKVKERRFSAASARKKKGALAPVYWLGRGTTLVVSTDEAPDCFTR